MFSHLSVLFYAEFNYSLFLLFLSIFKGISHGKLRTTNSLLSYADCSETSDSQRQYLQLFSFSFNYCSFALKFILPNGSLSCLNLTLLL